MNPFAASKRAGALALALILTACSDGVGPDVTRPAPPELGGAATLADVECLVDVPSVQVVCRTPGGGPGGPSRAILGNLQIKLASSNVVSDTMAEEWHMDVTIQNLMAEAVGTPDGVLKVGSKVFHETGPTVTAYKQVGDTGTVTVTNADGIGNFTKAEQPYHLYDTILPPQAVSAPEHWVLRVPRAVKTFRLSMKVFTPMPSEPKVPEVAPDSVPESTYAPEKISTDLPLMSGTYVRDVVTVLFRPGTSQEERQAAVNAVSGTVIGGYQVDGDGEYYVRIADDGTAQPLLSAIDRLAGLPQVIGTGPEFLDYDGSLAYIKPNDSPEFNGWQIRPALADSFNWGLEAIQAPYAWGCSTGSTATRVAVVDRGFHLPKVPDVALNKRSIQGEGLWPDSVRHGVNVSSVIAARGNNGMGTSGVMWHAGLDLFGVGADWMGNPTVDSNGKYVMRDVIRTLSGAIASGAPIINLSIAVSWKSHKPVATSAADQRLVNNTYRRIKGMVLYHQWRGRRPLLVIAAGNTGYQYDAWWSGYPRLVDDFEERVLVVGAAMQASPGLGLASFSQTGARVEIAAPGVRIGMLNAQNTVVYEQGTSFAAPMVAGVAGLLLSMDPRLTAAELKDLILAGAAAGGVTVANTVAASSTPVLNAYQALRKAAERTGAPLCGNRVWLTSGGAVYASRGPGAQEHLFTVAPGSDYLGALHGGDVRVYDRGGAGTSVYRWSTSGWSRVANSDPAYSDRGPMISSGALSHGGDSLLVMTEQSSVQMFMQSRATGGSRLIGTVAAGLGSTDSHTYACTRMIVSADSPQGVCRDSLLVGYTTTTSRGPGAYSPRGDTAVLGTYRHESTTAVIGDFVECPDQDHQFDYLYYCRGYTTTSRSAGSTIYRVTPAGTSVVATMPGRIVDLLMPDGLSSEIYARAEFTEQTSVFYWQPQYANALDPYASWWQSAPDPASARSSQSCLAIFHDLATGVQGQLPQCEWYGGTIAPMRQPAAPGPGGTGARPAPRRTPAPAPGGGARASR